MIKILARNVIQNFGFLFNKHTPSNDPNVLLFSLPRSGSTWVQELIWSQPNFKYINEPFNFKGERLRRRSKINGFAELYTEEARQKVLNYLSGFVRGKYHFLNPNPLRKHSRFFTSRLIFKIIHGGECFINEIADAIDGKIVYLIRNPVAVALSRKQLPRIEELSSNYVLNNFTPGEQNLVREVFAKGDAMEMRIMAWCVQNKLALMSRTKDWLVLSYEELTLYPDRVIESLAIHCELRKKDIMLKSINVPSAVTSQSNKHDVRLMRGGQEERLSLIRGWRDRVSDNEVERYFEICRQMNFEVYTKDSDLPNSHFLVENFMSTISSKSSLR